MDPHGFRPAASKGRTRTASDEATRRKESHRSPQATRPTTFGRDQKPPAAFFPELHGCSRSARISPKRTPGLAPSGHSSAFGSQKDRLWQRLSLDRLAPVMDAGRARFLAVGERLKQIGELGVAVLRHELRNAQAPTPAARLADDSERRPADVRQGERAVAGHGPSAPRRRFSGRPPRPRG